MIRDIMKRKKKKIEIIEGKENAGKVGTEEGEW